MDDSIRQHARPGGSLAPSEARGETTSSPQATALRPGSRFELRDPFAEVTHRAGSFSEMVATADRLGALRFVAIKPDGERTSVIKEDGQWVRPKDLPDRSRNGVAPATPAPARADPPEGSVATKGSNPHQPILSKAAESRLAKLEVELSDRYVIKRPAIQIGDVAIGVTEYRQRADASRVAFTESASRLGAATNSPSIIRSMVDVAEIRGWRAIRVSGSDDFKRLVWLEASLRRVQTFGYEPTEGDRDRLRMAQRSPDDRSRTPPTADEKLPPAVKPSGRGGGRKTVLAAIDAILVAKGVPAVQRDAVMAAAAKNLEHRVQNGDRLRVRVFDRLAPSQRAPIAPVREQRRSPERPSPSR